MAVLKIPVSGGERILRALLMATGVAFCFVFVGGCMPQSVVARRVEVSSHPPRRSLVRGAAVNPVAVPSLPAAVVPRSLTLRSLPVVPAKSPPPATAGDPDSTDALRQSLLTLTNTYRRSVSVPLLQLQAQLTQAAQRHAEDMAQKNYFDHTSPNGDGPWERAQKAGYPITSMAENIAMGAESPGEAMQMWINSKGHRENLENDSVAEMGVGLAQGNGGDLYWVQLFGSRGGTP